MRIAPVLLLACASLVPVVVACKKPEPAVVDAGAVEPVPTDAAPTVLTALDDDAGMDAGLDAGPHHHAGGGLNTNQARAKQCCNAIRAQGKSDPMIVMMATQCDQLAMQLGPTAGGQAPEFAPLRALLKNAKSLPPICQGL